MPSELFISFCAALPHLPSFTLANPLQIAIHPPLLLCSERRESLSQPWSSSSPACELHAPADRGSNKRCMFMVKNSCASIASLAAWPLYLLNFIWKYPKSEYACSGEARPQAMQHQVDCFHAGMVMPFVSHEHSPATADTACHTDARYTIRCEQRFSRRTLSKFVEGRTPHS